jgi:hypothetical protein
MADINYRALGGGGGGATDISRSEHETYGTITNDQRIIVAGGGGGGTNNAETDCAGGYGGGTSGGAGSSAGTGANAGEAQGGTQTGGGASSANTTTSPLAGSLGMGGRVALATNTAGGVYTTDTGSYAYGVGGGGGYYGGGSGVGSAQRLYSGAGGSGYVDTGSLTSRTLTPGNASMPNPAGGANTTGRSGDGYARITLRP